MNKRLIAPSLYHFLCGASAGIFGMLAYSNQSGYWALALWATAGVGSACLSGYFRACIDNDQVFYILRRHGLLSDKSKSNY